MPDGLIIVVLKKNYVILNKNLVTVSNIDVKKLDPCVYFLRCFSDTVDKKDFILAIAGRS